MSEHLALWHSVETTDTRHVKEITGKAYRGNSPKPYWLILRATETFGPCGIGWGFDIVEEKLLDGALVAPGFFERVHMARVRLWYRWGGERGQVEHVGQTLFCGLRKDGKPFSDEDAPKKSVTDALVKALSMIGFAGDIFLGRWDDSRYVDQLKDEERRADAGKVSNKVASVPKLKELITEGEKQASRGTDGLKQWWDSRSADERKTLGSERISAWKREAEKATGTTQRGAA